MRRSIVGASRRRLCDDQLEGSGDAICSARKLHILDDLLLPGSACGCPTILPPLHRSIVLVSVSLVLLMIPLMRRDAQFLTLI